MNDSLVGSQIDDLQVLRHLGQGGMANVYAARQTTLGRDVAIKVLRAELARDDDYVRRFRREARAAASLNHPHIVTVIAVGSTRNRDGLATPYIVQELIDGPDLKAELQRSGALSAEEVREVLLNVGAALSAASQRGIVHRDIKPENLMKTSSGLLKVADFGLARVSVGSDSSVASLTKVGLTLGTPRYMSPEQIQGRTVDVRSDLYSLGVTAYHLLTGRPPFEADDPVALAVKHLHETPEPISKVRAATVGRSDPIDPELSGVIMRLMAKDPEDRYATPADMMRDLGASPSQIGGRVISGATSSPQAAARLQTAMDELTREKHARRKRRVWTAALAVFGLALGGVAAWQLRPPSVAQRLRPETVRRQESVTEQYLTAMARDDVPGWNAVAEYFPPDSGDDARDYAVKSQLQVARLMIRSDRPDDARRVLRPIWQSEDASRLHRTIALVLDLEAAEASRRGRPAAEVARQLRGELQTLEEVSPDDFRLLQQIVPESRLMQIRRDAES